MACTDYTCGNSKAPEPGATLGPWVQISFTDLGGGNGRAPITVGNHSSEATDPKHAAVINGFELGYTDGITCRVTIHDQQGGSFVKFMEHLLKDWACMKGGQPSSALMKVTFGWTKAGCQGPMGPSSSQPYFILCDSVETNYSQGKWIFEITGTDICKRMFEGGSEEIFGGEGQNAMHLIHAVDKLMLMSQWAPNVGKVSFKCINNGVVVPAEFKGQGPEKKLGPKQKWICNGQNKLETVRRWLLDAPSSKGKGWIPQWNPMTEKGELIFWEDPKASDGPPPPACASSIGTYIVNGGKESSVLEFNPKIRWDFSSLTAVGGSLSNERLNAQQEPGSKNPGRNVDGLRREDVKGAGLVNQTTISDGGRDRHGNNATKEKRDADNEAKKAMKLVFDIIEADLVLVGDPTLAPPNELLFAKTVALVVVNPFVIAGGSGGSCGEWIATPPCNDVLSNKCWRIHSVTHRIEVGVYTTTLGITLDAPGVDTAPGSSLGCGWTPPLQC